MDGKSSKGKRIYAMTALCAVVISMLYYNDILTASVQNSIKFCTSSIIPSLFLFLIVTDIITRFELYPQRSYLLSSLFLGLVCGFPSGARFALSLYNSGKISKKKAEYLNAVSNNASISFTYGFAARTLGIDGIRLVVIQLISIGVSMILLHLLFGSDDNVFITRPSSKEKEKTKESLLSSVRSAVSAIAVICAFIIIFSALSDIICSRFNDMPTAKVLIKGALEFSSGIKEASALSRQGLMYGAMILCWAGICVCFQIKAVIKDAFSIKPYIASHLIQSVAAGLYVYISFFVNES